MYFEYSKKESLEDLEAWIEGETSKNLTVFMKFIAVKYLWSESLSSNSFDCIGQYNLKLK